MTYVLHSTGLAHLATYPRSTSLASQALH